MATAEIKKSLYNKNENIYVLTPEEEQMIAEAEAEFDAGLGIPLETFQKRTDEWLEQLTKNLT
ncbi:MAG: hypothetical protein LBK82_10375 [Planctomycetaceae bacterium]|jgi:hypothetical protein|nr:hypothetical protein [Planctomycetaceae bacterium]